MSDNDFGVVYLFGPGTAAAHRATNRHKTNAEKAFPMRKIVDVNGSLTKPIALLMFLDAEENAENPYDGFCRAYLYDQFGKKAVKACIARGFIEGSVGKDGTTLIYFITELGQDWLEDQFNDILTYIDPKYFMPDGIHENVAKVIMSNMFERTLENHPAQNIFVTSE